MLNALSKAFLPTLCNLRQRALRFSLLWQWLNRTVWKKSVKQSFITNAGFRVVLGSFGGALWDFLVALRSRHGHRAQGAAARHVSLVKDLGERVPHQNYFLSGGIPSPCFKFWTTTCERMVCRLYSIIFCRPSWLNLFVLIDNLKNGKFHQHLRDTFAHQVVRYVDLMESSIGQSIHKGFEKEKWEIKGWVDAPESRYRNLSRAECNLQECA